MDQPLIKTQLSIISLGSAVITHNTRMSTNIVSFDLSIASFNIIFTHALDIENAQPYSVYP